jgi:predicted nucleic acid-binding protein
MYLLDTQQVMDLFGRNQDKPIFAWLAKTQLAETDLFVSVISLGQIAHAVEDMDSQQRNQWRRLVQEGRRKLEELGSIIDVDGAIVEVWQSDLRGDRIGDIEGGDENYGEDDRLIIATAIARGYALVTEGDRVLTEIAERTTLTLIEP